MKKGLMLVEGNYLNMDSIVEWWFDKDSIHIMTTLAEAPLTVVIADSSENQIRANYIVKINEFHRIKREISEYMGIDCK